jgi:hypothetical protein
MGVDALIAGSRRDTRRKLGALLAASCGGVNTPSSRNDLMLDMVSSDEAEGERRMIGSWRLDLDEPEADEDEEPEPETDGTDARVTWCG